MDQQETSESQADDAALVECLNCAKKIPLSEFHLHENNCEGGSSGVSALIVSVTMMIVLPTSATDKCKVTVVFQMFPRVPEEQLL